MRERRGAAATAAAWLGASLGAAALLALLETVQESVGHALAAQPGSFGWIFRHLLPPWLILGALAPLAVLLARRAPVAGGERGPGGAARVAAALALHATAAAAFAVAHLGALAAVHRLTDPGVPPLAAWFGRLLAAYFVADVMVYAAIVGATHAASYYAAYRERERTELALRASLADARLRALRAQLHPHFLFNALNGVSMLVRRGDGAAATDMLAELAELLRRLTRDPDDGGAHEAPLAEELDFLRRYLAIERARFRDRLRVRVDAADDLGDARVPPLVLQPLVENALRHGVARRPGPALVEVRARREGGWLRLEVRDDGPGLPPGWTLGAAAGVGLRNTGARLAQLYAGRHAFTVRDAPGGGVVATVVIPFDTREGGRGMGDAPFPLSPPPPPRCARDRGQGQGQGRLAAEAAHPPSPVPLPSAAAP
ncbi:MAG TPA: histidine kinase [Gemmatimonadaceae bacterium]|nr:histidine kinase [Gemmatimonadaceae bacterium]